MCSTRQVSSLTVGKTLGYERTVSSQMYRRPMTDTVWRNGLWKKNVGDWDRNKDVENDEKDNGTCEQCYDAGARLERGRSRTGIA